MDFMSLLYLTGVFTKKLLRPCHYMCKNMCALWCLLKIHISDLSSHDFVVTVSHSEALISLSFLYQGL